MLKALCEDVRKWCGFWCLHIWILQDFTQTPPAQELVARDLHDQDWHFRHIYRGEENISWSLRRHWDLITLRFIFYWERKRIMRVWIAICIGQPRRHLLTTGWSVFVSAKRLQAGDSVLFIRYLICTKTAILERNARNRLFMEHIMLVLCSLFSSTHLELAWVNLAWISIVCNLNFLDWTEFDYEVIYFFNSRIRGFRIASW